MTRPKRPTKPPPDPRIPFQEWAHPKNKDLLVKRWELLSVVNIAIQRDRERRWYRRLQRKLKEMWPWKRSPSQLSPSPQGSGSEGSSSGPGTSAP